MKFSASDLIHLVLGLAVIGGTTFLAAIHVLSGDAVIPTYLAAAGISGAVQVGASAIRAVAALNTAAAPGTGASNV